MTAVQTLSAKRVAAKATSKPATKKASATKAPAKGKTIRKADKAPAKKTAPKAATPKAAAVAFVARTIKAGSKVHAIAEDARPVSGKNLFAHTHAALTLLGLLDATRPAVPQKHVLTVMGQRAVTYHSKQMNFESAPNHGIRLSTAGRNWFVNRMAEGKVDTGLANAFMTLFIDGKADPKTGVAQGKVYQTML
jgi:hypothetical protein